MITIGCTSYTIKCDGLLNRDKNTIVTERLLDVGLSTKAGKIGEVDTISNIYGLSLTGGILKAHVASPINYGMIKGATTENTLLGAEVGTPLGLYNTMIGHRTGLSLTSGAGNIIMGYNSGSGMTVEQNNIIIGSNSTVGTNVTNSCVLGNNLSCLSSNTMMIGQSTILAPLISSHDESSVLTISDTGSIAKNNTVPVWKTDSIDCLQDVDTSTTPPMEGSLLKWDGSKWTPTILKSTFAITAERNGIIVSNENFSFGNGASAVSNAIVLPMACELYAFTINCAVSGVNTIVEILRDGASVYSETFSTLHTSSVIGQKIIFEAGQRIGFNTKFSDGTFADAQVAAWFQYVPF